MAAEPRTDGEAEPASQTPNASSSGWVGFASIGFEFVAAILLPGAIGWWLDRRLGTAPWIMLGGGLLGFVVGLRLLMRTVNSSSKGTKPKR